MFEHAQVQSYNQIKAPVELKQKVFEACSNQETATSFSWQKATARLAPIAACLLLLMGAFALNRKDPLLIKVQDAPITSEYRMLDAPVQAQANPMIRTVSLAPASYTVTLSLNQDAEILSAQGEATMDEDGTLLWKVDVPNEDTLFELSLQTEDETYDVSLQYLVNDGSFSIRCEKQ